MAASHSRRGLSGVLHACRALPPLDPPPPDPEMETEERAWTEGVCLGILPVLFFGGNGVVLLQSLTLCPQPRAATAPLALFPSLVLCLQGQEPPKLHWTC